MASVAQRVEYDPPKLADMPPMDLVSIPEAATIARCPPDTIYRAVADGRLRCWGTQGRYRVSLSEVLPPHPASPRRAVRPPMNGIGNLRRGTHPPKVKTAAQPAPESRDYEPKSATPGQVNQEIDRLLSEGETRTSTVVGSE